MAVTTIAEPMNAAEFMVSEANGYQSREVGVISGASDLPAGTVLGRVTANNKYVILAPGASDGSQNAVAILYGRALVSTGDLRRTVVVRNAEVNGLCLTWPAGITTNQQNAAIVALAALGVIVRT